MVIERHWLRWPAAALIFAATTWLNLQLQPMLDGRAPLLPYFPALVIVGLAFGLGPALAVVITGSLAILYFWIEPVGHFFPINTLADAVLVALFLVTGSLVGAVSAWAGRLMRKERDSRRRLSLALAAGRMVTWDWDAETGFASTAGGVQVLFGRKWNSLEDVLSDMAPADAARFRERYRYATESGGRFSLVCPITRADNGEIVWTQFDGYVSLDAKARALHAYGVAVDVTTQWMAQEELLRESRRKDAFLATLAHELRNPMAPIRYAVAMLRQPGADAARVQATEAIEVIGRQSAHMARLLDDLLDMSRVTRNVVALRREVLDLRGVVRQALEAVQPLYRELAHRVVLSLPDEPVPVDGDPTRLQQVLGNLLDNAAKYSPVPGEVRVDVTSDDGTAQVVITDRGVGIALDRQAGVFELFTRIDAPGAPSGLGIGLAVSRQLMQLHEGSVSVESEGLGHGSRFIVRLPAVAQDRLPRAEEPVVSVSPEAAPAPAPRDDTPVLDETDVLVVDDNEDGANTLAEVLRGAGYRPAVAFSGEEALSCFDRLRPRAILLDIGLPGISGLDVAKRLRAVAGPEVLSLIAITGWGQRADREATSAAGFDAHLVKPVEFGELEDVMQRLPQGARVAP